MSDGRQRASGRRSPRLVLVALTFSLSAGACGGARSPAPGDATEAPLSVAGLLSDAPGVGRAGGDGEGDFARALTPRPFVFPDDDGPHPAFRSEWWYFTGVLRAGAGGQGARRFGYEMTIFRQALARERPARPSAWATRDLFMAHFAITDVDGPSGGRRFHAYERFARDGLGLAGAGARPFAVWVDDWRMQGAPTDSTTSGATPLPIHLAARGDDGGALDLTVGLATGVGGGGKGPIAEGDRGLAAKGPAPGNASFYYSRTALPTSGRLILPAPPAGPGAGAGQETSFEVAGDSWMDREWGTGALGAGVRGWDWLGVHLSDGRDLVLYRLRDADGRATAQSRVTLVAADGGTRSFGPDGFTLTPLEIWVSPRSGVRYPVSFRLEIPGQDLQLMVRALLADQELQLAVRYWEGAVSLEGTLGGVGIAGEGYLELTGYGGGQRQR
jgi:predicted secreted hydrolase